MLLSFALLAFGILLIYFGARWLVEGASELAAHFGVSPLIIGLTIVGFGTSAPELMLAVVSGAEGAGAVSIGNVTGANIANATYILGACAMAAPLLVRLKEIRRETLFMIAALAAVFLMSLDGTLSRAEGLLLVAVFAIYLVLLVRSLLGSRPGPAVQAEFEAARPERERPLKSVVFLVVGLALLVLGTDVAVQAAVDIAVRLGVSQFLIGLTIITFGTTTPEFASSLLASFKGRSDLALGNIIGTLFANTTLVLGSGAIVAPLLISNDQMLIGIIPQLLFGIILIGVVYRRECLRRPVGALLLSLYIVYLSVVLLLTT